MEGSMPTTPLPSTPPPPPIVATPAPTTSATTTPPTTTSIMPTTPPPSTPPPPPPPPPVVATPAPTISPTASTTSTTASPSPSPSTASPSSEAPTFSPTTFSCEGNSLIVNGDFEFGNTTGWDNPEAVLAVSPNIDWENFPFSPGAFILYGGEGSNNKIMSQSVDLSPFAVDIDLEEMQFVASAWLVSLQPAGVSIRYDEAFFSVAFYDENRAAPNTRVDRSHQSWGPATGCKHLGPRL